MLIDIVVERGNKTEQSTFRCSNVIQHGNMVVFYDAQQIITGSKVGPMYPTLRFNLDKVIYWGSREEEKTNENVDA